MSFLWHNEQDNSFQSPGTSVLVGATAPVGANGTFTSGDFLLAAVAVTGAVGTITPPAGWTLLNSQQTANGYATGYFYKIAGGSETGSYSFSWTGSNGYAWGLWNYGAVTLDTSNTGAWSSGGGTAATAVAISPTGSADILVGVWTSAGDALSGPPTGMTNRVSGQAQESGSAYLYSADQVLSSSGTTGNRDATIATFKNGTWLLAALTPAGGGGTSTFGLMSMMGVG